MTNQFLPSYTIGTDAYDSVYDVCRHFGKTAVLIGGHKSRAAAEPLLRKALEGKMEILDSLYYGGDATFENAEALKENEAFKKADMVFAMGGGRAMTRRRKQLLKQASPISPSRPLPRTALLSPVSARTTTKTTPSGRSTTSIVRPTTPSSIPASSPTHQENTSGPASEMRSPNSTRSNSLPEAMSSPTAEISASRWPAPARRAFSNTAKPHCDPSMKRQPAKPSNT